MARNGKIILAKNIKLDKEYQNVLTYSESDMLSLVTTNAVASAEDYSFIRENGRIRVGFSYNVCLSANYMAFQNPDYNNKWFFAFIDKVNYVANGTSEIEYTVDIFSTWWSYWDSKACFVVREHVNDDTVGANLIDEGLSLGEFVCDKVNNTIAPFSGSKIVVGVSEIITGRGVTEPPPVFYEQGGIFNGICYIVGDGSPYMTSNIVRAYDKEGKSDAIQFIFMAPSELIRASTTEYYDITGYYWDLRYALVDGSDVSYGVDFGSNSETPKPTTLNGYTPVNKKLLTAPYVYLLVDPHTGNSYTFNYEDFSYNCYTFSIDAMITPGCSVKITPTNYKGVLSNYLYSFPGAKFPMCSWSSDAYTNWLTTNGVDLGFATVNKNEVAGVAGLGSMVLGGALLATGVGGIAGAGLIAGGASGLFSAMQSDYKASLIPDQVRGNSNIGDINFCLDLVNPTCYEMSIKSEVARSIDNYFSKLGYKVNKLKVPNLTGRENWNFVQIATGEILAYQKANVTGIPSDALATINRLYQRGLTLWHSHTNLGDYSLSNNIITP